MDTVIGQIVNFLGTLQNEWAGAMAFNSFDTYLAPFVRKDKLTYNEVKQALQSFIFSINVASRWGGQTPFVNLTFDLTPPKGLRDEPVTIDGEYHSSFGYYGEFQKEMDMLNEASSSFFGVRGNMDDEKIRQNKFPLLRTPQGKRQNSHRRALRRIISLKIYVPVSYTHLTLPTN